MKKCQRCKSLLLGAEKRCRVCNECLSKSPTIKQLEASEVTAVTVALEMAAQAQEEYLEDGDIAADYGPEWPEARSLKQAQFSAMAQFVLARLGNVQLSQRLDRVAARVAEIAAE